MKKMVALLVALLMLFVTIMPVTAADLAPIKIDLPVNIKPILINPELIIDTKPIPIAFGAVANRFTGVDPATAFDLNGDLVSDLKVENNKVTGQNGAKIQLLNPAELNLDNVHKVPTMGYSASVDLQLSRVYVAQLSDGYYAKFMVLQSSPKVTLWFMSGKETSSVLTVDGTNSKAALSWDALPDAALGYNIYRYEVSDTSYTVTQLNDFTVQETTFVDNTAKNRYYLYVVQAIKTGGTPGALTTVANVFVTHKARSMELSPNKKAAKLDGTSFNLDTEPVIKNGLMMVPVTSLTKAGATVKTDATTGTVTITRRLENVTYTVVMNIDNPDYTWNGTKYTAEVAPYKNGNHVMVPLRVVAPVLGLGVAFNSTTRTATIGWYE